MSEFLLDEAMGYNRRQQMDQVGHLANAGLDDRLYDDDFFANRPEPGGQQDGTIVERMPSFVGNEGAGDHQDNDEDAGLDNGEDEVIRVNDDQDDDAQTDYQSARTHQSVGGGPGLIQEEPGPLIQEAPAQRRPSIAFSRETNSVEPWMPRSQNPARAGQARSNSVMGKYWRTFGERKAAIGGGIGGFFGALFGGGMRRANALAGARARRAEEKAAEGLLRPSAMRSQLANAGSASAHGTKAYPREPGVVYDDKSARAARKTFKTARQIFRGIDEPSAADAQGLMTAHAAYDLATGNRSQPMGAETGKHTPDKFSAIVKANEEWGDASAAEDIHPHQPKPRLRNAAGAEKRVRFMDGANAEAAPVPRGRDAFDPKPRPTGVQFHPIDRLDGAQRTGNLTDDDAVDQEAELWPIRNRLQRMDPDRLEVTAMNAGMQAHVARQGNLVPGSPEAEAARQNFITGELGGEVSNKRVEENNERAQRSHAAYPTSAMNRFQQMTAMQELMGSGDRRGRGLDPTKHLDEQLPYLPSRFFKNKYWNAYDARVALEQRQDGSMAGEDAVSDAGVQGAPGGGGGAGLIEEEELQQ